MRYAATAVLVMLAAPGYALWAPVESLTAASEASGLDITFTAGDFLEDGRHGWVAGTFRTHGGQRIAVLQTTDGRRTWSIHLTEIDVTPAVAVDFVDATHGRLLAGDEAIYRTEDGGRTWRRDAIAHAHWSFHDIAMVGPEQGYASGWVSDRELTTLFQYQTDDAGWQEMEHWGAGTLRAVAAHGLDTILTAGVTPDGVSICRRFAEGAWEEMVIPSRPLALEFVTNRRAYAACSSGRVFETNDAGATWREKTTPALCDLTDVRFGGGKGVLLSPSGGLALVTENRGDDWTVERVPEGADDLLWDGSDHLLVASEGLYLHREIRTLTPVPDLREATTPGLAQIRPLPELHLIDPTWREASELHDALTGDHPGTGMGGGASGNYLSDGSFLPDGQHGWFVGYDWRNMRIFLRTTNGGLSWEKITPGRGLPRSAQGIFFMDEDTGWMWGDTPFICRTQNGGETWAIEPLMGPGTDDVRVVRELSMFDTSRGLAVADVAEQEEDLLLRRSPDEGVWRRVCNVATFSKLAALPPDFLWLGHSTRYLAAGTDPRDLEPIMDRLDHHTLTKLMLHDRSIGWAMPYQETFILRTIDGGESWAARHFAHDAANYAVDAGIIGTNQCFILTRLGRVLRTRDGGENWEEVHRLPSDVDPHRSSLQVFGNHVYVCAQSELWTTAPSREPAVVSDDGIEPFRPVLADRLLSWSEDDRWAADGVDRVPGRANRESVFRVQWDPRNSKAPGRLMLQLRGPGEDGPMPALKLLRPADWWATHETGAGDWGVAFTPTDAGRYEYRFFGTNEDGAEVVGEPTEWREWTVR